MMVHKRILIIAGPNGAGNTTFALEFLPNEANCPNFVNADLIAAGVNPFRPSRSPFRAGRLMLATIRAYVKDGQSFALETALSGRGYARHIPIWQAQSYWVTMIFLRLSTEEVAIGRVALRVAQGGHDVAEEVIRRRFRAGWHNFEHIYRHLVNDWAVYDNSGRAPVLLEEGGKGDDTQR